MMKELRIGKSGDFEVSSEKYAINVKKDVNGKSDLNNYDKTYILVSSSCTRLVDFLKTLKIEVFIFIYMFSYIVKSVSSMTMIMEKVCRVDLAYQKEICDNLEAKMFESYKSEVESVANNYHLYQILITFMPSAILSCFIGPWSDKYGRKLPMIMGLLGCLMEAVGTTICAYYLNTSVKYYLIPAVFSALSGGLIAIMTVFYSYASDITDASSRTLKYTLIEVATGLGSPMGALAGGWIFKFWGYVPVFSCSVIGNLFALCWVVFMLKETRGLDNKDPLPLKIKNLFSFARVIDGFKATAKPRPNKGRIQIWMLLLAMSISVLAMTTQTIAYIYIYHIYGWSNTKYSTVSAVFSVIGLITILVAVPLLTKVFKFGDPTLGIFGSISLVIKHVGLGLATHGEWIYFLANLLGLFMGLTNLAGRSRISKIVSKNDLGKVFAFMASAESILPIASTIFITRVYNATVKTGNPGLTYLSLSLVLAIDTAIFIWLACLPSVNYEEMHEENEKQSRKNEEETQT